MKAQIVISGMLKPQIMPNLIPAFFLASPSSRPCRLILSMNCWISGGTLNATFGFRSRIRSGVSAGSSIWIGGASPLSYQGLIVKAGEGGLQTIRGGQPSPGSTRMKQRTW